MTAAKIESVIDQVLSEPEPAAPLADPGSRPENASGPPPASPADPSTATRPPDGVPENPNVAEGESIEDVRARLGSPSVIADLGAKIIYLYPTLKIVFNDGKVSSVQRL